MIGQLWLIYARKYVINQSINQSINQPTNQPTNQSINQSIYQSINLSINYIKFQYAYRLLYLALNHSGKIHYKSWMYKTINEQKHKIQKICSRVGLHPLHINTDTPPQQRATECTVKTLYFYNEVYLLKLTIQSGILCNLEKRELF